MTFPIRGLLHHFNNRISEVVKALIMMGMGVQVLISPSSEFHALDLLEKRLSENGIALLFLGVGSMRMAALIANGSWPEYGPWMRAIGALVGALIWSNMFLSLMFISLNELSSLGAPIFFVFTMVELVSIYRALAMRDHNGRGN